MELGPIASGSSAIFSNKFNMIYGFILFRWASHSKVAFNSKTNLVLFCPVTSRVKGYPFEVILPADGMVIGAVLSDQIKSLDWKGRKAKLIAKTSPEVIVEVLGKIGTLTS